MLLQRFFTTQLLNVSAVVLAMLLTGSLLCPSAEAAVTTTGDVTPNPLATDPSDPNATRVGNVGRTAPGTLRVDGGSQIYTFWSFIGYDNGVEGSATVEGPGSLWNTDDLSVGHDGIGELEIRNGGQVNSAESVAVGKRSGSTGDVTVFGPGAGLNVARYLTVGSSGSGSLTVENGAQVTAGIIIAGSEDGSSGIINISGENTVLAANSPNISSNSIQVGYRSYGELNQSGGTVTVRDGDFVVTGLSGNSSGLYNLSGGTLDVTGSNIFLSSNENLPSTINITGGEVIQSTGIRISGASTTEFNQSGGVVQMAEGGYLQLGIRTGKQGTFNLSGGVMDLNGGLISMGDGISEINITGGELRNIRSVWGDSDDPGPDVINQSAGYVSFLGSFSPRRPYNMSGGTLDLNGGKLFTSISTGGFFYTGGSLVNISQIDSDLNQQIGTLAPGNSPGNTLIQGDYTLGEAATLEIELASVDNNPGQIRYGFEEGVDYDFVRVQGTANLSGNLDVLAYGNYHPQWLHSYDVLTADQINTSGLTLIGIDGMEYRVISGGDGQILQLIHTLPEPASATLLILGTALLLRKRAKPH